MHKNLARAAALAAALLSPFQTPAQTPPLKVGFVYVSPVGEAGWSYQHDLGRREMERALGARVKTTVVEAVAEGADSERVMRDLAAQGHQQPAAWQGGVQLSDRGGAVHGPQA